MIALHLLGDRRSEVRETEIPELHDNEVLVKVCSSAICGSEKPLYAMNKTIDALSGHEAVGIVADAGKSRIVKEGDHVAIYALYTCGECYYCKNGLTQFCRNVQGVSSSSHAQYTACRDVNCIRIDPEMPFDSAVLVYGDTLGVAYRAMQSSNIRKGATAYVIGAGPIGLGIMAYLKYKGVRIITADIVEYRREIARTNIRADTVLNPLTDDVDSVLKEKTEGLGPEYVFECSGNPDAELSALSLVRCFGTVCFAGENYKGLTIIPSDHVIHKEIKITGAFYYAPSDAGRILSDYNDGLEADKLVTHKFPLSQADKAFDLFMNGKTGKVIIHPWD